jgi:hypothetical protein
MMLSCVWVSWWVIHERTLGATRPFIQWIV